MSDKTQKNSQDQGHAPKFQYEEDPFYNLEKAASDLDCTGLVPSAVQNEAEAEAYGELYAIHPPQSPKEREEESSKTSTASQWAAQTKDAKWQERQKPFGENQER